MASKKPAKKGKPAAKRAVGRPTDYRPEYAEQAYKLCLLGATDAEMGNFFGVSEQTINAWKQKQPKFLESINDGKGRADAEVADKLIQRAKGYSHKAVKMFQAGGSIIQEEYIEHYPPDTTAAIFWLKNRQPDKWRDRKETAVGGSADLPPIKTESNVVLSDEEAYKRALDIAAAAVAHG